MAISITDSAGGAPVFTQWEADRVLTISGTELQPQLRFAQASLDRALVVHAEVGLEVGEWICRVPNFVLQFAGPLFVSVCGKTDDDEWIEIATRKYIVQPRMKPQDYDYTENIGYISWLEKSAEAQAYIDGWAEHEAEIQELVDQAAASAAAAAASQTVVAQSEGAAEQSAVEAAESVLDSEAWAKGTRGGTPVTSGTDGYHDNAKYYKQQAAASAAEAAESAATLIPDTTLTQSGQAAEAKAAGDAIDEIKSALTTLGRSYSDSSIWEIGQINASSGGIGSGTTTIHTKDGVPRNVTNIKTIIDDSQFAIYVWNGSTYVGCWNGSGYQTTNKFWKDVDISDIPASYTVRIGFRKVPSSEIAPSFGSNIVFTANTDVSLSKFGAIADAATVGNTFNAESIKYFSHGIPVFPDKEAHIKSTISAVKAADSDAIIFAVSADNHYNDFDWKDCLQAALAKRMAIICKDIGVDFIVDLGDMIEGYNDDLAVSAYHQKYVNNKRFVEMVQAFTCSDLPFLYCAGHHERYPIDESTAVANTLNNDAPFVQNSGFNTPEFKPLAFGKGTLARLNPASSTSMGYRRNQGKIVDISDPNADADSIINNGVSSTGASITYYVDVTKNTSTIRFLIVDGTFFGGQGYDPDTVTFVANALTDAASNNYKVVVFNHIPLRRVDYTEGRTTSNSANEEAFINALKNSGATILAYIHGHVHGDNIVTSSTMRSDTETYPYADIPFPMISINCQKIYGTSGPYIGDFTSLGTKNVSTYDVYSFDVVALHPASGILDFYRFGKGDNGTYPTRSVNVT